MTSPLVVAVTCAENERYRVAISRAAPGCRILFCQGEGEVLSALDSAEVVFDVHHRKGRPFARAPRLEWLHTASTGVDRYLTREFVESEIVLTNSRGIHAVPIAEHAMGLLLAHVRMLGRSFEDQRARRWGEREPYERLRELRGKTLGLVGVGRIGEAVAERARAFDMRVLGYRRRDLPPVPGVERMYRGDEMASFLAECDFVVVSVPLTDETRGMLGEAEFSAMKQGAYLVNVARGGVVDEDALVRSLRGGRLAGAAMDVFEQEPLPPDSPLYDAPGLTITPHVAGLGPSLDDERIALFEDNLRRYAEGRPLRNVVDKRAGY